MIIDYIFIVLIGALLLLSFVIFLDNERMLKDIIENPLPPPEKDK
jgi:hypothetical protein